MIFRIMFVSQCLKPDIEGLLDGSIQCFFGGLVNVAVPNDPSPHVVALQHHLRPWPSEFAFEHIRVAGL